MPFISVNTTESIQEEQAKKLKEKLGEAISLIPGKSENWLMLEFCDKKIMYFKGENDRPLAFVSVSLYGKATSESYNRLTEQICNILYTTLGIPVDCIYVKYQEKEHWVWNSSNF